MNKNSNYPTLVAGLCAMTAAMLAGCGGSSSSSPPPPAPTYVLGGTVTGLGEGAALTFANGNDSVAVTGNGSFTFPARVTSGASYKVEVTKSLGYDCRLSNGTATVSKADVTSIGVHCIRPLLAGKEVALIQPTGLAVDAEGNAYVADYAFHVIQKITPTGVVSIFAGSINGGVGGVDGPANEARFRFNSDTSLIIDRDGNLIVTDACNQSIRKITKVGVVSTVAGRASASCNSSSAAKDGVGSAAVFDYVGAIALDVNGDYLVGGGQYTIRRVTPAGVVTTIRWTSPALAGTTDRLASAVKLTVDKNGTMYALGSTSRVWKIAGGVATPFAGGALTTTPGLDGVGVAVSFRYLQGLTSDNAGNLYVTDYGVMRKISADGTVTSLAGAYFAPNNGISPPPPEVIDGIGAAALINMPASLAIDAAGNIVALDHFWNILRYISPQGLVTTHPGTPLVLQSRDGAGSSARFSNYSLNGAPTVDDKGNIFVRDSGTVRMITPDGTVSRYAGTLGLAGTANGSKESATLSWGGEMTADSAGNLYLLGGGAAGIRKIGSGSVSTVFERPELKYAVAVAISAAGNFAVAAEGAIKVYSQSGTILDTVVQARIAALFGPVKLPPGPIPFSGLAYDSSGNLFISDRSTSVILKLSKEGTLSTFAGKPGVPGMVDGAPGTGTLDEVGPLAIDPSGNLYTLVLLTNDRSVVRKITPTGVISTAPTPWSNHLVSGVSYGNGRLYAMSKNAMMQMWAP